MARRVNRLAWSSRPLAFSVTVPCPARITVVLLPPASRSTNGISLVATGTSWENTVSTVISRSPMAGELASRATP